MKHTCLVCGHSWWPRSAGVPKRCGNHACKSSFWNRDKATTLAAKKIRSDELRGTRVSWREMKQRCLNRKNPRFKDYGGRGIAVCEAWVKSFDVFLRDMGIRPEGKSLDRINVDGNYEPSNCRWATPIEQQNNMRTNRKLTHRGETKGLGEWAESLNVTRHTLDTRLRRMPVERALTMPFNGQNSK